MKIGSVPYNFVPLSSRICDLDNIRDEKVRARVLYDVPFKDGLSGTIDFSINAFSPLFIKDSDIQSSFSRHDGRYFIPASSLKGCIRSVLEIMSFSKMSKDFVADSEFGFRDLNDYRYKNKMGKVLCGWMYYRDGKVYVASNLTEPYRIEAKDINTDLHHFITNLTDYAKEETGKDVKTAQYKVGRFLKDDSAVRRFRKIKYNRLVPAPDGGIEGMIVLTGQPGARNDLKKKGKHLEFVFPTFSSCRNNTYQVDKEVFSTFEQVHSSSKDYTEWREAQLKDKSSNSYIPVFFQYDESAGKITSIGLSYMYKFPYERSVHDGLREGDRRNVRDMADEIFGYVHEGDALKGRVQFLPAYFEGSEQDDKVYLFGEPHASYYPAYLQDSETWHDDEVHLRGRKRYPIRELSKYNKIPETKSTVKIRPVDAVNPIKARLRFFNLRPFELGALLAAMTFDNDNRCYHNIGMGKALGYGTVRISVNEILYTEWQKPQEESSVDEQIMCYIDKFKAVVREGIGVDDIENEPQWRELMAMARDIKALDGRFDYMPLPKFKEIKTYQGTLQPFSTIYNDGDVFRIVYPKSVNINYPDTAERKTQICRLAVDKYSKAESLHLLKKNREGKFRKAFEVPFGSYNILGVKKNSLLGKTFVAELVCGEDGDCLNVTFKKEIGNAY